MFARLARFVVRHPWWTIAAWLAAAVVIIAFSPKLTTESDQGEFLPSKYESVQAAKLAEKAFPDQADLSALIVVQRSDGGKITPADSAKITEAAKNLTAKKYPTVQGFVTSPQAVAPNKSIQLITVPMEQATGSAAQDQSQAIKDIRTQLPKELGSGLEAKVGGEVAAFVDNEDSFTQSFALITIATFVLIIGLILLIFRAPLAAILPIIVIIATEQVSMGLIGAASKLLDFSGDDSLQIILTIVLFGIGADYYLFLLFRYRERLRAGEDRKTALISAVERVGEVITSAAAAIAVTFLVLMLASFGIFAAWGPSLAIGVLVMGVTSLTLFPAILSLLGPAVFWPSKSWKKQPKATVSHRLGGMVGARPALVAIGAGALLVALASGALGFKSDYDFQASFPQDTESAQATKDLQKGFPAGQTVPVQIMVRSTDGQPLTKAELDAWGQQAKSLPGVGGVQPAELGKDPTLGRVDLVLNGNPRDNDSINLVKNDLGPAVHKITPEGTELFVGGETAIYSDINRVVNRDLSVILPVAGVLIALILLLLLRSVVAPIYLVPAVLLGFAATLGSAVYVFQGLMGEAGEIFHLPIMLYLFVLAIGTDYNILMTARLREEAKEGHEPRKAAALAVEHGGPTVAAAGLILAGTFSVMLLAKVSMLQQMGFSIALGIALSAFVMAIFLVPGLTALLGHRAWWPGHGDAPKKGQKPVGPADTREDFVPSGFRQ
ncbi:putative drug exporter of the RND superfamily [Actinomadura meyerae]|jgi:RND superfamily putative drug exporter|uniref:Putative drug exporter of the RND superfamily n=1 Tax=Actinomadura meyerae TaxID=240840 RepID=A0A239G1B8_9ACTN|nr:MMPL family transporter [Actinomadura meyerae]SNS62488.1 putative drug exporter of the RND superfamily [Actinomadura meyerae]